jgi:glycosyltransferase involved in cell wall biosynthesis
VAVDMISAGSGFAPAAGGMTTYYQGLLKWLPTVPGVGRVTAFMPATVDHLELVQDERLRVVRCRGLGRGRASRVAYEHLRFPDVVASHNPDVLLSAHNVRPLLWRGRSVVVLQSMQHFFIPARIGAGRRAYLRSAVPRSLRSADRVIAVSEAARRDAISLFGLDPKRVVAVYHGCSPWAIEAGQAFARYGLPAVPPPLDGRRPYVAMVSALYELKNHRRLIQAFARAVQMHSIEHELVIAGREADVSIRDLRSVAEREGIRERVRFLGPYPQDRLPALLANADALVYPSLYETFGHPVLEAFAFRRPLLTANTGGASEVAGDAAVKVDPRDVEDIASGLGRLLIDRELRTRLVRSGTDRLASFSWRTCAAKTGKVLRSAVSAERLVNR